MTASPNAATFVGLLLFAFSLLGCGGRNLRDPSGTYYAFSGDRPTDTTFEAVRGPVATLSFGEGNSFVLTWIMVEDEPEEGTWSRNGNKLTLSGNHPRILSIMDKAEIGVDSMTIADDEDAPLMRLTFYKMSPDWEESMRQVGLRDSVLANARSIAKAALIYASDYHETLPSNQKAFEEGLPMYGGDAKLLKGFTYTFKGGKLPAVSNRASTELGFLKSQLGTATVFLNGDAKWDPRK